MNDKSTDPKGIRPTISPEEREQLEQLTVPDPDDLLKPATRTRFSMWFVSSIAVHAIVIGVTSMALFVDWMEYGVLMPAAIDQIKQEEADRQKLKEQQAAHEAAATEEAENKQDDKASSDQASQPAASADKNVKTPDGPTAPPEPETADPVDEFNLDDIDLDF